MFEERFEGMIAAIPTAVDFEGAVDMFNLGFEVFSKMVESIFEIEGQPAWQPLSERTQEERRKLRFSVSHPILERTGTLRRGLTDLDFDERTEMLETLGGDMPFRVGNRLMIENDQKGIAFLFGTSDERFYELQVGVPNKNIPPRPMVPMGSQQQFVGREIQEKLVAYIRARLHHGG